MSRARVPLRVPAASLEPRIPQSRTLQREGHLGREYIGGGIIPMLFRDPSGARLPARSVHHSIADRVW
jgi:hypothetical protein